MYRRHVRARVKGTDVLNYLIKDDALPRSVSHCIEQIHFSVVSLPKHNSLPESINNLIEHVMALDIQLADQKQLHLLLDDIQARLGGLHQEIQATWFSAKQAECEARARK